MGNKFQKSKVEPGCEGNRSSYFIFVSNGFVDFPLFVVQNQLAIMQKSILGYEKWAIVRIDINQSSTCGEAIPRFVNEMSDPVAAIVQFQRQQTCLIM